ncbi:MAG: glycosyltransferase family 39 protein [Candidatus Binataceae bacterium]
MAEPQHSAGAFQASSVEEDVSSRRAPISRIWVSTGPIAALVLLGGIVFGFHLGAYGLWEPDEARYAEIAREMLATRDFLVPHLNYVLYVEKPPLLYWITAVSFSLFGYTEFAARLVSACAALVGVLATYLFARRVFDRRRALLSGAILTTIPLYAIMAQVLTTDMLLTAAVTAALFAFYLQWKEGGRWCWIAYAAIALGVLAKGPVAAVLPFLAGIIFLWWEHDFRRCLSRFRVIPGLILTFVIAAPWFIYMIVRVPDYFSFYFIGEHLRRFLQSGYSHAEPIYFYLPVLALGLLPWSIIAPFMCWRGMRPNPARRFCVIAAASIFVFFSLAQAKLIPYVMPALAPLAVLIADATIGALEAPESGGRGALVNPAGPKRLLIIAPIFGILGAGALLTVVFAPHFRTPYLPRILPALGALGAIGLIGGALTGGAMLWRRANAGLAIAVITLAVAFAAGTYARLETTPLRSYAKLGRIVAARAPEAKLICYRKYVQSLPFYTHRRVILAGSRTELAFGARHAADAKQYFFNDERGLLRLWKRTEPTVIVLDVSDLERLKKRLQPFTVIASEWKKRAIIKSVSSGAN